MSPRDQLNRYIESLQGRLRKGALTRGVMLLAAVALIATVVLVWSMNALAFANWTITGSRLVLLAALIAVVVLGLVKPWRMLNRRNAAARAERVFPQFEQRLVTVAERSDVGQSDPFLDLLAADTLTRAQEAETALVFPTAKLAGFMAAALVSVAFLVWMITAGPGYWGHGAKLLWAAMPKNAGQPFYELQVQPGDLTLRRGSDQLVTATPLGFRPDGVRLYARYESSANWETVEMRPSSGGPGVAEGAFEFLFASLREPVEYYVQSGAVRSERFTLKVKDLPQVTQIDVEYKFPDWTGLAPEKEPNSGDLRAVEGTEATLTITSDRPIENGLIVVDGQRKGALQKVGENTYSAKVTMEKDGMYHVAAIDGDERMRLSQDYFIEARKETPPDVRITKPGRDYRASPIEEVTVHVDASDDFGLRDVTLHYSVNGGDMQSRKLASGGGNRQEVSGAMTIALEEFGLVPGDLVSFYASASDARNTAQTDMFFIEAQPFEREYSQSQQGGGGGGGGGGQQDEISQRQKEIIAATFNQVRDKESTKAERAEVAEFLANTQTALQEQAQSLARRMQSRELTQENQEFANFGKEMIAASEAMGEAASELKGQGWQSAMPHEQRALQHLLRAESTFRQIQVAFGNQGGGGGGGGAGRDLESLFDLELDTEKNQYETGQAQTPGGGADQGNEVDKTLERLKELARRQQELARQQQQNRQSFEQRWQQEMLRREAEELQRQLEQMARNQSNSQSSQQSQNGQRSQSQSSQSGQQSSQGGRQGNMDPRIQQTLEQLQQATEDMRRAQQSQANGSPQREADAQRAAARLQEATDLLQRMQQQNASGQLGELSNRVGRLADRQKDNSSRTRQAFGDDPRKPQPGAGREQAEQLARERDQMVQELNSLERDLNNAARSLAGTDREASNKVREALGEMQQDELRLRMEYNRDLIREGYGPYVYMRDQPITQGLSRLEEQIQSAQRALGQGGGDQPNDEMREALSNVERLRQQLQDMQAAAAARQQGQNGQQGGQQQGQGQQQGGQQGGQQQGGQQGGGQQAQNGQQGGAAGADGQQFGGRFGGGGRTGYREFGGIVNRGDVALPQGAVQPVDPQQFVRDGLRDLRDLRSQLAQQGADRGPLAEDTVRDVQGLIRELQTLDPSRFNGNPAMVGQLSAELLAGLEQLEMKLRRQLEDPAGQVRSGAGQPVPAGYRDSVADYFRRLSKGNN